MKTPVLRVFVGENGPVDQLLMPPSPECWYVTKLSDEIQWLSLRSRMDKYKMFYNKYLVLITGIGRQNRTRKHRHTMMVRLTQLV